MSKAVILHLSDIHLDDQIPNPVVGYARHIAEAVFPFLPEARAVFIVVSGDIAWSGLKSQYDIAKSFLLDIRDRIAAEKKIPVSLVLAPGNHDCDFQRDDGSRKAAISLISTSGVGVVDQSIIDACTKVQDAYFEFASNLAGEEWGGDRLMSARTFSLGGRSVTFECLNVSWTSKKREDQGGLYFPFDRYEDQQSPSDSLRILVMHHPLNWIGQSNYRGFRDFVRRRGAIVLSGHEHQSGFAEVDDAHAGKSLGIEGAVTQHHGSLAGTGFNVICVDLSQEQYEVNEFLFDGSSYLSKGAGSWSDYRALPPKKRSEFQVSQDFLKKLQDPGAYLTGPQGTRFKLSDIYVFPDMVPVGDEATEKRKYVSSSTLASPAAIGAGLIIEAEEKYGATSLLYQLFYEYQDSGVVPIYLQGEDLRKSAGKELDASIDKAVRLQYEGGAPEKVSRLSRAQRVALVDDFDDCPIKSEAAREQLLKGLCERFGSVVLVVGPMFEMKEFASENGVDEFKSFRRVKLQPFGSVRRSQLIRKWYELRRDESVDEAKLLGMRDQAEKLVSGVMNKSLIPHSPLFLLTLLQSIELGRSGELKDSALGHYYHFLLTSALQGAGVKANKLDECYQFSAHLAWEMHSRDRRSLTHSELSAFCRAYSAAWSTIDLGSMLGVLVEARVLEMEGADYVFRYPYIYYFLKGYYISQGLDDESMRRYITECCRHLYVRDNANTVLFLAHHAKGGFVIKELEASLRSLFGEHASMRLEDDVEPVTRLISDAPRLTYEGGSPEVHRERRDLVDDENDDGQDGMLDRAEPNDALSLSAKLIMLTKTGEILGQVLKDQYAKIPRERKEALIQAIFDGSLRSMSDFFSFMSAHSEKLISGLKAALEERGISGTSEESDKFSRQYVANVVQAVAVGLIMRCAQNVASDDLSEEISTVVKREPTLAYQLIELASQLDSARPIPRPLIEAVYRRAEGNIVVGRILTILVLNRLYMFRTSEADMNWLAAKLRLSVDAQKAIAFHREDAKVL